jgi:hypothetical protein
VKTITKPPAVGLDYPLRPLRGLPGDARLDTQRRTIYGVAIIQRGALNEGDVRKMFIDDTTLSQVVKLGNAPAKGLKARWTHPNMSSDGLGSFLGRWKKFRLSADGATVLADLHLSPIAFRGESGGRGQYVMDMARDEPDAFGVSIFPFVNETAMEKDERDDGFQPMRIQRLVAGDVVDEPAATRGGFFGDSPLSIETAPRQLTHALNQLFADATPEVIRSRSLGFLDTYLASRFGGQGNSERDDMSTASNPPAALTQEALDSTLKTFGETLSTKLLGLVDQKIAAIKPADKTDDAPLSVSEIQAAERKRCGELQALAKNTGLDEWEKLATGWVEKGLSLLEAKAAIGDLALAKNGLTKDSGQQSDDPEAKYKAEYQKNLASFTHMGLSLQEYITSRKIDDGAELLAPKSAEAA